MGRKLPFVVTMSMLHTVNGNAIRLPGRGGVARYFVGGGLVVRFGIVER